MLLRVMFLTAVCCASISQIDAAPGVLDLCEVAMHASDYSHNTLRLRAILATGAEQTVLYDPNCLRTTGDTYVSPRPTFKRSTTLDKLIKKDRRAWVIVEGTFHGLELARIDPKLPQWMQDRLKGTMERYGHLGSCATMIEVSKIISVEPVAPSTPWPSPVSPANERGWLVGSAGYFGNNFLANAANVTLAVACGNKRTSVQSDKNGDYAVQLDPCEYRLVSVVGQDGNNLRIRAQQARQFVIRDGGTTRFDVMLSR